jgi:hypothetical protein
MLNLQTLKLAEAAGAKIQAYTVPGDDGSRPFHEVVCDEGYWRTLDEPVQGSCHITRYRVGAAGMSIERLMALEKKWRVESDRRNALAVDMENDAPDDAGWNNGIAAGMDECADELASLIAELGQEVGAVCDNCGKPLRNDAAPIHACACARLLMNPARTSEARDAAMRLLYSQDLYGMLMDVQNGIDSPASASIANSLIRRIDASRDAAMRQEAE